jgi:hypothetical protein
MRMGAEEFGHLVRVGIATKGLSQGAVGRRVTKRLRDDRGLDATQVRLVMEGRRRLDHDLVEAFIDVLDLDAADAWEAAGLWPPDLSADDYRVFAAVGGAAASVAVVQLPGTKRNRSPYALRLVRAA